MSAAQYMRSMAARRSRTVTMQIGVACDQMVIPALDQRGSRAPTIRPPTVTDRTATAAGTRADASRVPSATRPAGRPAVARQEVAMHVARRATPSGGRPPDNREAIGTSNRKSVTGGRPRLLYDAFNNSVMGKTLHQLACGPGTTAWGSQSRMMHGA